MNVNIQIPWSHKTHGILFEELGISTYAYYPRSTEHYAVWTISCDEEQLALLILHGAKIVKD